MPNNIQKRLSEHLALKPKAPRIRSMVIHDATPEAIAWHLHAVQPSAGLISAEGGTILNGRAMHQLPMLNTLWDGGDIIVNRKNEVSFKVRNARLTINLMVQYLTFKKFLARRGLLARDNGFLARALICDPPSTQGIRMITTIEPALFPKLEIFQKRLTVLLLQSQMQEKQGGLA